MTGSGDGAVWDRIHSLLMGVDFTAATLAVVDLPSDQRSAVAAELRAHVKPSKYDAAWHLNEAGVAIAGAAVLPNATSVAAWLSRFGMRHYHRPDPSGLGGHRETSVVPNVFYVLSQRGVPWLGDLAQQLADRLPRNAAYGPERFELVCRLVEHTGMPVPTSPGFVAGWVYRLRPDTIAAELTAQPDFAVLVPLFFAVEEVGAALSHDPGWPEAIAEVVRTGAVDRDLMLDACLARLARDGRPGATRTFLAIHDALAPSMDEAGARVDQYVAMLDSTVSTAASTAQRTLFDLDDREMLATPVRLELARATLRRTEKKLVRAQLARISKLRDKDDQPAFARLIVSSWDRADADIVRAGMRTITAMQLPAAVRGDLADAAPRTLPADLAADLAELLGGPGAAAATPPSPDRQLALPAPAPLAPVTDLDTLITETVAILAGAAEDLATARLESVIDGLLIASARERDALRRMLGRIVASERFGYLGRSDRYYGYDRSLRHAVWALAAAAIGDIPAMAPSRPHDPCENWSGLEAVLVERVFALAVHTPLPPLSVCLPTQTNGLLDPDALLDRLGRAASDEWAPPPQELEQALLRLMLPAEARERGRLARAFDALGTDAGHATARWIIEGQPAAPIMERTVVTVQHRDWRQEVVGETDRVDVRMRADAAPRGPGQIWFDLVQPRTGGYPAPEGFRSPRCWPALAPQHRELIAAHCIRPLAEAMDSSSRVAEVLPVLAEIDGPIGDATSLALGYGLCTARPGQRALAQRGLLLMCARPEWDGPMFGRALGELFAGRSVVMKRALAPLRQVAADGAGEQLWPALREVVAALVNTTDVQPGLGEVLSLAAELAQQAASRQPIPGLSAYAARPGKSRQLVEARRLAALLTS